MFPLVCWCCVNPSVSSSALRFRVSQNVYFDSTQLVTQREFLVMKRCTSWYVAHVLCGLPHSLLYKVVSKTWKTIRISKQPISHCSTNVLKKLVVQLLIAPPCSTSSWVNTVPFQPPGKPPSKISSALSISHQIYQPKTIQTQQIDSIQPLNTTRSPPPKQNGYWTMYRPQTLTQNHMSHVTSFYFTPLQTNHVFFQSPFCSSDSPRHISS